MGSTALAGSPGGDIGDRALMEGIALGDPDTFASLFDRYAPTSMAIAHRIIRQRHLAEEAVQETFLAVWRHPERYVVERGSVRSWLMGIVHHRSVDLVRREESQRTRGEASLALTVLDVEPDPAEAVAEQVGSAQERRSVRRALGTLPPAQRQIIELMYFGGLSQSRISERLSLPLGTVKSRTLLGMRHLRVALDTSDR